jgi:histidyl-tRNA synthetase
MIGRFLGTEVPAVGFSLGFERIVELVELPAEQAANAVALLHDGANPADLARLKADLVKAGHRVRLAKRSRTVKTQLEQLAGEGYSHFAFVGPDTRAASDLELRALG